MLDEAAVVASLRGLQPRALTTLLPLHPSQVAVAAASVVVEAAAVAAVVVAGVGGHAPWYRKLDAK